MGRLNQDDLPGASSHSLYSLDSDDLPPPYTDEPSLDAAPAIQHPAPSFLPLRLVDSAYILPGTTDIKPHDTRAVTLAPILSRNSDELFRAIRSQMKLPLRPLLGVRGTHTESSHDRKEKRNQTVTDFEFQLDLAETMLTGWEGDPLCQNWMEIAVIRDGDDKPAFRGGILRSRTYKAPASRSVASHAEDSEAALLGSDTAVDTGDQRDSPALARVKADLQMWCERFCLDPSPVKSFTLHRHLQGFDYRIMHNVLASHIQSLNYRGSVNFWFSKAHSSVTIYSPHWINRMRTNKFIWWVFVILQLWIVTWPIIWLLEKRYEVAHTQWNASLKPEVDSGLVKCYAQGRDESALAEYWTPAVKQAAWSRRRGEAGLLTRLDADRLQGMTTEQLLHLRAETSDAERNRQDRVNRGEAGFVDNVVGLVRGIGEVRQDWRLTMGWGGDC
ncbi:hypothetical protein NUU61_008044 [Penicillium alfredii]|uniref:Uncharacterized protein n=1 Tax=Penicillium alfredii TaxID=1506179 RepID=A0A9W9ERM3_9EURO|nr:uncharacterized protein NUU61_008044 [Penicillium alfredii]KAJ5086737.1 hypothetical protein NUU61_008044 [Penicillium alfredii]